MVWSRSRRWVYGLLGLGMAIVLSLSSLFFDYGRVFAAGSKEHCLAANAETVHWGYFSPTLAPQLTIDSGDMVTVETLTHHANDDAERMVQGDPGAESGFAWSEDAKGVDRRGAGRMDASVLGRGAGEGFGVHILTGPIHVNGAEPGDIIEVKILDAVPRPSANPEYRGKTFGSNAAAWRSYRYNDLIEEPNPREVITIYEIDATGEQNWAEAVSLMSVAVDFGVTQVVDGNWGVHGAIAKNVLPDT